METLDQLGLKYGTDKASSGHNYLQYYQMFFEPIKNHVLDIMEIGVWEGASLKLWQEWFPNARIYGVDIQNMSQYNSNRIQTYICDQGSAQQLNELVNLTPPMNIIIDDGGHDGVLQWTSFINLFPSMKPNSLYIIEDILCAWDSTRWGKELNILDKVRDMVNQVQMNGVIPTSELCADKRKAVEKYSSDYFSMNIEWFWLGMGIIVIKKI